MVFFWFSTVTEEEILTVYEEAVPTRTKQNTKFGLVVFTNTVLLFLAAKTGTKLFVYHFLITTTSTKQLKCYCLEVSEIRATL